MKIQNKKLHTLYQFILENGFELSIEEIAFGIHITKKTLYNRFGSRQLLENQVVEFWRELFQSRFNDKCSFTNNYVEQLLLLIYECEWSLVHEPVFLKREIQNHNTFFKPDNPFLSNIVLQVIKQGQENGEFSSTIQDEKFIRFFLFNIFELFLKESFPHIFIHSNDTISSEIEYEYIQYLITPILTKEGLKNYEEINLNLLLTV